ncbi:beta strand repeat-containing protein [Synechococcus sp. BA-132 BA5]|uniref:beta strand repeat-containing protein n=1 Tax=Synechococcus sp. BA-132 BA5 TaxID=3110252 RepID=UPI002B1EB9BF|nr:hypothetical protein [Synechococcus sp. BA-132 BA5]MEA5413652.1 hypothetical protein [Synechococcus sp. BA-132 BA5]
MLDAAKLATVDSVTIGAGIASGTATDVNSLGEEKITIANGTTLNVSAYTNQELAGFIKGDTAVLNITSIDGAVLDAANLADATTITIGAGSATIDCSTTDEAALAAKTTVNNSTTLTINNYVNTDLSGLSNQGTGLIVVNTTTGAVLDETKLADATSVVLGAAATGAASAIDGIGTNGDRINLNNQTLSVSGYSTENLSGITSAGTLNVTTSDGAVLDAAKLATVASVTLFGVNTATAADADTLGSRLAGTATLNITTDPITVNTDLRYLGSSLTLQFGGDNAIVVNGATLSVRQDQVNDYTISGTGTVSAEGSASADTFNASSISATLNLSSLAGNDSIIVNPADLSSADRIDGGNDTDTLIFSAPTTSVVDGAFTNVSNVEILQLADGTNTISLGTEAEQAGIATVTGGTGNDTLNLLYGSKGLTFNAGEGIDTLSYSTDSTSQAISLNAITAGTASGTVAGGGTDSFSGLEAIVGGSGTADSITSTKEGEALIVTGANAGNIDDFTFSGVESVNLASGDDTATILNGGSITSLAGGDGNDSLNLDGAANSVTITGTGAGTTAGTSGDTTTFSGFETVNGLHGNDTFIVNFTSTTITLNGGDGTDSLSIAAGDTDVNTLTISELGSGTLGNVAFSGMETINLGDGDDTATILSDGLLSGNLNFGAGTDTLNYASYGSAITVEFKTVVAGSGTTDINGATGISGVVSGVENIIGSKFNDTLDDSAVNSTVVISGANSGIYNDITFSSIENLLMGGGVDAVTIASGGSISGDVSLGGGSENSLTLEAGAGSIGSVRSGSGNDSVTIKGGSIIGALDLGDGTDSLSYAGYSSGVSATLSGTNTLSAITAIGGGVIGVENITLSSNNDTFTVADDGILSGALDLGDGNDTLSYAGYTDAVTVSLNGATSTAAGGATGITGAVSGFETLIGGSSKSDTLNANAGVNTLIVVANGSITLDGSLTVSGFETINLGSGSDSVTLAAQFFGTIDGGAGDSDVLNLNASANDVIFTSPGSGTWGSTTFSNFEIVNLLGGNDSLTIEGTGSITSVDGGSESDSLILARDTTNDVVTVTSAGAGSISSGGTSIGSFTNFESIDLGSGSDTLTYASYGSAVSLTLDSISSGTGTTTTGGATGFSGTISGFETVVGSGSSDTLIASAADNTLNLTGDNQGTVDELSFSSFESVDLAGDDDTAQFTSGDSLSGTLAGGDGIDTLDYSAYGTAVVVNLATGTATATGGISGFETVLGSSGNDTITASTSGDVNLLGNGGNDTFNLTVAGLTSGDTIGGGDGSDRIVFTNAGTINDAQFTNVSSVESVTLTGVTTINLGSEANEAGIATVTTGTGATTVNSSLAGYDLTIDAASLGDGNSLTLTGSASSNDFTVTGLNGSVLASGTSGNLTINTDNAGDNAIGVTTGSGNTTINASGAGDIVTVNADAMKDNTNLDINGSATFTVTNLEANTDAVGSTGVVSLAYTNVSDNDASIITGSGATTVSGTTSGDTLTINATSLAQNTILTTSGGAQQVVTSLVGDISATALTGTLTVTTADAADNGISITTGSNTTTITANGAGDTITVSADQMVDNKTLDINGGATFSVSNLEANTDATGTSGFVSLAYTDVTDGAASISTGSGAISVSGTSGDTLTIDATALANDITLTLQGEATMVVTGLSGDLNANSPVSYSDDFSSLDGWTGGVLSSNTYYGSFLGRYADGEKTNGQDTFKSFALAGQEATVRFDVHRIDSWDTEPFSAYVNDTVAFQTTFTHGQNINATSGSTNGFSWTITPDGGRANRGFQNWDDQTATVTITVPSGLPTIKLGFGSGLNQDINDESYGIDNLEITTAAAPLSGSLSITTADNKVDNDINITTGTNSTTITANGADDTVTVAADALLNNITLTQIGSADQVVTGLVGDINATALTGTLTVTTADATDNSISITVGTNNTTITASGADDTITVAADALLNNITLTQIGSADQVVTGLVGDINATALTGTLTVTTGENTTDDDISISTGTNNTTITASGLGDTITVNADQMADNTTLDINGSAVFTVTNLEANTDAAGSTGVVSLAYTDVSDNAASIITGSGATTVSGTTSGDTLTINATSLAQNTTLTASGDAQQVVTSLVGDISATDLTGMLTVTTADAADNGISISTGSNNTTITASGAGDIVTVDAEQMADNTTLDINGSATFTVTNLEADTDAAGSTGVVNLAYTDVSDNAALIITGSGATTVSGTTSGDTLTIDATSLAQNTTLTASGDAQQVVTNLVGDISATALTGTLTVTTADPADNGISITTGTNNTTITASGAGDTITVDAEQMADNTTLDINGSATFTVTNLEANTDAAGSSGALSITFSNITDNEATLLSGSGNVVVDGGDKSDMVTVTGLTTNNQTFNAQVSTSNFNISAGDGNQTITGSNTGNDSIDGGNGDDTLSYAGGNTIDLTITAFDTQAGGSTGQGTDTFSNIDNLIGSAGSDVLRGIEAESDEIATVNAANAGTFADVAKTGSFDFSSFEQLDLNAGNDVLAITGNGSLSGSADGGAGTDRLDYSAYAAGPVTVDLNAGTATAIAGDLIGTAGDSSFEDVYGSAFSDTITGDDTANVIRGYGGNDTIFGLGGDDTIDGGDGTNGPDGDDLIVAGDGADLILGSAGNDFISGGGYAEEEGTYFAVGDESIDTLSYIARNEGLDLSLTGIDQGTVQADAGSSLAVSTFTNTYSSVIGQQLITVPTNQVTTDWTDTYGDIQNLVLTNQNDIVRFDVGDVNTGSIDAAGGSLDTLDYSSFGANTPVLVNLSDEAEYNFDFDDNGIIDTTIGEITIVNANSATNVMVSEASSQGGAGGVSGFEVVIGGAGDDAIVGNDANNLLVGNAGNDRIDGGAGNDTIYGGDGDDYITPGAGADLVIAGAGLNTIAITSSDLAEDVFNVDRNGINTFKLQGDGTQTTSIAAPSGDWNPGADGIALLDGGDPVVTGSGPTAVTTYDTIQGTALADTYEFGGTALKNIDLIDLGAGDDSVGTAASTKGIKVTYDGNTGTDSITLNFTFAQFAKLNASGLYVADVQNFLDDASGETFSSSQADFTAQNFEAGGIAVITPAVYNALQGDPAALTFNSAFGARDSTISSGDDVTLTASALTTSTATALSAADIVSAFVQASGVKGSDAISITSGGGITGSSTASQDAVALSRTVDDRADSVLSAYGLGTDRSSFTAGDDITLSLSGSVNAETTAEAAGFVVNANGTVEVAGSRDSSLAAADALDLTITASGLQTVAATNVEGLAIAGLASRAYGIDDANLTDSTSDSVQAGSALNLLATASSNNRVTAQTAGNEALGTITLVDNGPAATDRFTTSQTGASFPLINGDRVRFTSSNASVQADRDYYVINAIGNLGEFQLSSEPDGSPVDVVAGASLQGYRPAVATADAISTVTGVELTRTGAGQGGVQAGDALSLQATATDVITATATSVAGDATAGVFRLGGMDGLNLASDVSKVQALVDTVSLAGRGASLNLDATDTATLIAASTEGAALTEANIRVFGSNKSASTAGDDLSLSANAELNLSGSATSTAGSAEARSGAGAGAGVAIPLAVGSGSNVVPTASSFSVVTGLADGTQTAGTDLAVQARGATTLNATASTVSGAGTLGSLWTSATGDILATFDLNLDTTLSTPSFVGPEYLAAGQLVQLDTASAAATGLAADTDYAVKLLGFGAVDATDAGATANSITMPTGITYLADDAVRFRLNSTAAPNSGDSRYGLALGTTYYVVNPTATTFQLSASPGGAVIDLIPDSLGPADQLVDADRFQLLTLPTAPGGTYSVATLNPGVAGTPPTVSLTLPSVANAFAGSREADRTLNSSDDLNLAQVSGISGNGGLRGLFAGAQNAITALASGVLNAIARNTDGDATASAGLVAEGLSDTAISAGSAGTVKADATITAVADAATTGDNALVDNALADLTITARGLTASDPANTIAIAGTGDVQSTASLSGRSSASTVLGDSDALAALQATGLEALSNGFTASIGQQGDISAAASIGSLAAPLIISALSSAEGDATAQAAAAAVGILGSFSGPAFSSLQAGTSQGDISGTASADLNLSAIATNGIASVTLADVPGTGRASITGMENMALTAGAGLSSVDAMATGRANLLAQSVVFDASSQGNTSATGLFSSSGNALPVSFADNGRIAAIAQQSSFAQSISVNGNASSSLNNTSLGIGNATITISGDGSLDARALSQLDNRAQSVTGAARA